MPRMPKYLPDPELESIIIDTIFVPFWVVYINTNDQRQRVWELDTEAEAREFVEKIVNCKSGFVYIDKNTMINPAAITLIEINKRERPLRVN